MHAYYSVTTNNQWNMTAPMMTLKFVVERGSHCLTLYNSLKGAACYSTAFTTMVSRIQYVWIIRISWGTM